MNKTQKITFIISGLIILGVISFSVFRNAETGNAGTGATLNLIGTRTGSSTVPVDFRVTATGGQSATTTYPKWIGNADTAVITLGVFAASSTANVKFNILGSNDSGCDTSTTTPGVNVNILKASEVQWFDASSHLSGSAVITSIVDATSTIAWTNPTAGYLRELILTDLSMNCLALQVSASSTRLWSQIKLRE